MRDVHLGTNISRGAGLKLPLFLTVGRIFISPIFLSLYLYHASLGIGFKSLPWILIVLFAISEISDFFDGFLARKLNLVTELGKILDPMADSITRLTMLLTFTQGVVNLPLLLVFLFICRETMISSLRTLCAMWGVTLAARMSGKIKAVVQAVTIFSILFLLLLYAHNLITLPQFQTTAFYLVLGSALYTLFSGIEYIYTNQRYIVKAWKDEKRPS